MESKVATKVKEALPEKKPKKRLSCGTLLGGFLIGILILFLLAAGGIAAAVSATGLVEIPVLSKIFYRPPAVTEDFSYTAVSDKQLESKLETLEGAEGKVSVTLTDDEANTLISSVLLSPDLPIKELLVKFSPGVVKVQGTLVQNDAPFYMEIALAKSADSFELDIRNSRLGALPVPGSLIRWAVGNFLLGGDVPPAGEAPADSLPADEITVREGSITIKGLDLGGLEEGSPDSFEKLEEGSPDSFEKAPR